MSDLQQQFLRKAARQKRKILFLRILFFVILTIFKVNFLCNINTYCSKKEDLPSKKGLSKSSFYILY